MAALAGLTAVAATSIGAATTPRSLQIEAESGQLVGAFRVIDDEAASGSAAVEISKRYRSTKRFDAGDGVLLCFHVHSEDQYTFSADVLGRNRGSNEFVVRVDYLEPWVWEFEPSRSYRRQTVTQTDGASATFLLEPGQHVVGFFLRESGTRVDKVHVSGPAGVKRPDMCSEVAPQSPSATPTTQAGQTETTQTTDVVQTSTTTRSSTTTFASSTSTTPPNNTTTTEQTSTTAGAPTTSQPTSTTVQQPATTTTVPQQTTTTNEPSGPSGILWASNFESGMPNGLGFSSDPDTIHKIVADPTGRGGSVLKMTGDTSDGNSSGNRARIHSNIYAGDPHNFPGDAFYSVWFYLEDNQTSNNIFQWKQAWSNDLSDPLNTSKWQTRRLLYFIRVNHTGNGNHSLSLRGHIDQSSGESGNPNYTLAEAPFQINSGEWHHLEARYVWSESKNGRIQVWLDGKLWADVGGLRTQYRLVQDNRDPLPGQPTFIEKPRQWTFNNYMITGSGGWNPSKTTIYFDNPRIATSRQGP